MEIVVQKTCLKTIKMAKYNLETSTMQKKVRVYFFPSEYNIAKTGIMTFQLFILFIEKTRMTTSIKAKLKMLLYG